MTEKKNRMAPLHPIRKHITCYGEIGMEKLKFREWNEEQRIGYFMKRIPPVFNENLTDYMIKGGFFTAPASTGHNGRHGAFDGGNFWHSREVAMLLREYTYRMGLEWERPESPEIVGWLHDLCKMDEYRKIDDGDGRYHYEHNKGTDLVGHGMKSALLALSRMYLTEEEIRCICWHMGAFTGEEKWDGYSTAVGRYPNILWTHQADMVASQVRGI